MSPAPLTPAAARAQATRKYERHCGTWAVGEDTALPLVLALHPPTESAALRAGDQAIGWVRSWSGAEHVLWGERRWASLGQQHVPERLVFENAHDVARYCGRTAHFARMRERSQRVLDELGGTDLRAALARCVRDLAALEAVDFDRLLGVLQWLAVHPDSGMYIRQLPIRGVDSKWVQAHKSLVARLHAAHGRPDLGLAGKPDLVRLRFLDPALAPGGLRDLAAPVQELAALEVEPTTVLVFENLESVLAMPPMPGAVVVHGAGYAVDRLARIPWIRRKGVLYWGDLDSHGFGILNRLRAQGLPVRTVLMDLETLDAFRDLWVPEPSPASGNLQHLLPGEAAVVRGLAERGNTRLEQERIDWEFCLSALRAAVGQA